MALVDISTLQTIATGQPFLAATLQQIRDNQEFYADPPACSVYNSTVQELTTSGTSLALTADSENFDNDSMHSTATNTSRITVQTGGRYEAIATVQFEANATGIRNVFFRRDGTPGDDFVGLRVDAASSGVTNITATRRVVMTAGQYLECFALQTSGGALDAELLEFSLQWITR